MTTQGVHAERVTQHGIQQHMLELAERLRRVRVVCGDWSRMVTPAVCRGLTAVLLDPPYFAGLSDGLYAHSDQNVSADVRKWAIENGDNPELRIALCGYEGEHKMPDSWETVEWKAAGGFGGQRADGSNENAERERIWFSPACLKTPVYASKSLFDMDDDE
jgi:site-specific DNA-adenine methylase